MKKIKSFFTKLLFLSKTFLFKLYKIIKLVLISVVTTVKKDCTKLGKTFKGMFNTMSSIGEDRFNKIVRIVQFTSMGIIIFEVIYVNIFNIVGMDMVVMLILAGICLTILILSIIADLMKEKKENK